MKRKLEFNAYNGNCIYLSPDFIFRSAFNAFLYALCVENERKMLKQYLISHSSSASLSFIVLECICRLLFKKKIYKKNIKKIQHISCVYSRDDGCRYSI